MAPKLTAVEGGKDGKKGGGGKGGGRTVGPGDNAGIRISGDEWRVIAAGLQSAKRRLEAHNLAGKPIKADIAHWRDRANALGVPKEMVDRVVSDAMKTKGDKEYECRLEAFLRKELAQPVVQSVQGELTFDPPPDDAESVSKSWFEHGRSLGLLGEDPKLPDGMPPENNQDFLKGHEQGEIERKASLSAATPHGNA